MSTKTAKKRTGIGSRKAARLGGPQPPKLLPRNLNHAHAQVANRVAKSAVRRRQRSNETKTKLSVAIDPRLLAWAEEYAQSQKQSLSAVIGEALERFKHNRGLVRLLEQLGGTDDISQEERDAFDAEMRKAGVGE